MGRSMESFTKGCVLVSPPACCFESWLLPRTPDELRLLVACCCATALQCLAPSPGRVNGPALVLMLCTCHCPQILVGRYPRSSGSSVKLWATPYSPPTHGIEQGRVRCPVTQVDDMISDYDYDYDYVCTYVCIYARVHVCMPTLPHPKPRLHYAHCHCARSHPKHPPMESLASGQCGECRVVPATPGASAVRSTQ